MPADQIKTIVEIIEKITTTVSVLIGGVWVYYRFILQRERYPNINFECDIAFIGQQNDEWLIKMTATLDNKGKAQHTMNVFTFSLDGIQSGEPFIHLEEWNGQANFPHSIKTGTFLNPVTSISMLTRALLQIFLGFNSTSNLFLFTATLRV
jgi:hypothetical protein